VDDIVVAEGHTRATWRNHVRDVLASLFGTARQSGGADAG
jgi:hypothetical protein